MPSSSAQARRLGALLQAQRRAAGWSLDQLAARSELDKSSIHRIEQGHIAAPNPLSLQRLAAALGTSVEDYFALVGYFTPHGLPSLAPYLRAKYAVTDEVAAEVETYFSYLQERQSLPPDQTE